MRKVIYGFSVALLTFTLGSVIYYLTASKPSSQPIPVIEIKPPAPEIGPEYRASIPESATPVGLLLFIKTRVGDAPSGSHSVTLSKDPVVMDDLDLDESIDDTMISIGGGDRSAQFRIFERYRTSMTVMGEGPHLDLIDWLHFDSEWIELDQLGRREFRSLAYDQMNSSKFPPTTKSELISAVRERASDWPAVVELAKTCRSPHHAPCAVSISSVYFRVEKLVGDRWIKVGLVEVPFAMGC